MANKQLLDGNRHTPWDVSTATYDDKSKYVYAQDEAPYSIFFKPDGAKMYIMGRYSGFVYQYSLSTPWDVSSASYDDKSKDIYDQDEIPTDAFFNPDGTKMYVVGRINNTVFQYSLSTPWDVSTASYAWKSKDVSNQDYPYGVFFKPDGTKMYMVGSANSIVYQYSLSTPWDVSSASYAYKSKNVSGQDTAPRCVFFKPDGTKMYITGEVTDTVYQYSLSTPWDVSTASYDKYKDVSSQDTSPMGVCFKPDGIKMYIMGNKNDTVYQYSLPPLVPTVTTQAVTDVQATTARLNGQISNDGGEACQYRFRYKKSGGSYIYTTWTGAKTTGQTFYEAINGLDKKSLYYFNAQAKNSAGESAWGSELNFTTLAIAPVVTTQAVSDIAPVTATGNGTITDIGGENCSKRGVCWNTTGNPTVADDKSEVTDSFGVGAFTRPMTGLTPGQHYYVRAYAYNSAGYGYGSQVEFTTGEAPTVTTQAVSDIAPVTATGHGNITDIGGENCSKRGVCWNTTGNPTVADSKSEETDSFGTGAFERAMTGLTPGQLYYVRAYAYNSAGYGYGGQVEFTTKTYYATGYIGDVIDCTDLIKTYDRLEWTEEIPDPGQAIEIKIRSSPDQSTWTVWEVIYSSPCTSFGTPVQRYLEWVATLTTDQGTPKLKDLVFSWTKKVE